jgi:hypothetical protein
MCVKCFSLKFGSVLCSNLYAVSCVVLEYIFIVLNRRTSTYLLYALMHQREGGGLLEPWPLQNVESLVIVVVVGAHMIELYARY